MEERILLALENVDDSNYIDKIINSFSYEDRLKFFDNNFSSKDKEIYNNLKYILTDDEISEILRNKYENETVGSMVEAINNKYLLCLFNSIGIDNKVKEFLRLDKTLMIYTCNNIFNTDELRKGLIDGIKKIDEDHDSLDRVVNSIINNIKDIDLKLKCIDKIAKIYPKIYLYSHIINIDESKADHYFNDLGLSDITKSILILKCSDAQIAKKYFLKLEDDIAKANAFRRFGMQFIEASNKFLDDEDKHIDNNFTFEDLKEMFLSAKDKNNRMLMLLKYSDAEKFKFLPLLSEEEKIELLSNVSDSKQLFKGLNYLNGILSITRVLMFYKGKFPRYSQEYSKFISSYAEIFNVNLEHLVELCKVTSLEIITDLDNKNIRSLINMDDMDFNKFVSFFKQDNTKLTTYTLNNIFDAFANKSFNLNYDYIMHYYVDVMVCCQRKDDSAKEIIKRVLFDLDYDSLKGYTVDSLYDALVNNNPTAKKDFHVFCNEYIKNMRKKEVEISVDMYKDEYLENAYEATSAIKVIMEHGNEWIFDYLSKMVNKLNPREKSLFEDKVLFNQIYEFKLNPISSPPQIVKTNMFTFNKIMDKFYNIYKDDDRVLQILDSFSIKKVPVIPDIDSKFLIDIMKHLNARELKNKLLNDDNLCKTLNTSLKKYSFLAFNEQFKDIQLEADTYCDGETISSLFLNYSDIIKSLKKSNTPISMSSILDNADTYNKSSKVYKDVFGEDNFRLITLNPPLNRANSLRQERREESLRNYIKCYKRTKVAVPSFDEDFVVNNKQINAVVGNFTNPINLTLGERTGSCMRSGGIGEDLYDFCLNNDNGFHIVFSNPETGEFISRVSGFRNGNTVFLNLLRESTVDNYDSDDLIKVMKQVANRIIEMSKESNHPIDNVVISPDRAMENYEVETVNLNASNIFKGMSRSFWFDLSSNNAMLLSSSNDDLLVPVNLGQSNIDYYNVQRDKVRLADNPTEAVNHIEALEQILSGKKLEDIKTPNEEYDTCYYGEDWYIAVDKEGKIFKKVMSKSKDYESAFKEMSDVLDGVLKIEEIFNDHEDKLSKK